MTRRGPPPPPSGRAPPGKVRIVAGRLRNSRLAVPVVPGLRPTPERVRETLFNWLMPVIAGSCCLDLFAGSGALGFEAASRGAREVVLVEQEPVLVEALRAAATRLQVQEARVERADAARFLAGAPTPFDIVFLDPPFAAGLWTGTAEALESRGWLAPGALVYVESPADVIPAVPANWAPWREARAGDVRYALYRRGAAPAAT